MSKGVARGLLHGATAFPILIAIVGVDRPERVGWDALWI